MTYIGAEPEPGCLFCRVRQAPAADDRDNLVLLRRPEALVMMNRFPYNNGHLLVAPRAHLGDLAELDAGQGAELFAAVQESLRVLRGLLGKGGLGAGTTDPCARVRKKRSNYA